MENVGVRSKKFNDILSDLTKPPKNHLNGIFFIINDSIKNITESQILSNS
jgi:hypothetical protein